MRANDIIQDAQIQTGDVKLLKEADVVLSKSPFVPVKEMKRLFNLYSDNIYITDPSRKNMYLDGSAMLGLGPSTFGFGTLSVGQGGAVPESKETLSYLYRNEALDNLDALQAELKFILKQGEAGKTEDMQDLRTYMKKLLDSFDKYLKTLPEADVGQASRYADMKK
ncbi:hypothetical protein GUITHDRAFT_144352 [Guillardia theta CCMP2712]|uniref:Uncharacterized protein n=1 Tax=Guillardia theta (strain CCMP2712) TaxID=905079 RepID=L1IQY7_GUITC|nr:hypothetical protein GUITHDRAFT_144352 [Guillardia theta CCMP2712]EKX38235.1 hypothetical protein GUITHDRAFT_144352 [Guillardia theta CCMP2712]|eukprot:XP_005825215.1 hypothetical protein GUITHDRAFT_144352 [Guillardia theta CCMP2712]